VSRRRGMTRADWAWVVVWIVLALAARWWLTGEPPWPEDFRWEG